MKLTTLEALVLVETHGSLRAVAQRLAASFLVTALATTLAAMRGMGIALEENFNQPWRS